MSKNHNYAPLATDESGEVVEARSKSFSMMWRAINGVVTVFFLLAGFVQINDPDPYIWVPIYVIPAVMCLSIAINPDVTGNSIWRWSVVIHLALCLACIIYTVSLLFQVMKTKMYNPLQEEEGRELAGLVIIVLWLFLCRFTSVGSATPQKGSGSSLLVICIIVGLFPLLFWGLCFNETLEKSLGHCKDMFPGMLSSRVSTHEL